MGSWVIGYWRPRLHFEVNAWNCFKNRANRLLKAARSVGEEHIPVASSPNEVISKQALACVITGDARETLDALPAESVSLILTDPPHSDRIPYLELSEMWNAILGFAPPFEKEIVVSNARGRGKDQGTYAGAMRSFFEQTQRVLQIDGHFALLYNARDNGSWDFLRDSGCVPPGLSLVGSFPLKYSAGSVVQDNRSGSLKNDFVIIYRKEERTGRSRPNDALRLGPGWRTSLPLPLGK